MMRLNQRKENKHTYEVTDDRAAHKTCDQTQRGAKPTPSWRGFCSSAPHPRSPEASEEPRKTNNNHCLHSTKGTKHRGIREEVKR